MHRRVAVNRLIATALAAATTAVAGCGSHAPAASAPAARTAATFSRAPQSAIPRQLLREARPIGRGERFHPGVTGRIVGPCRRELGPRVGVHIEVFGAGRVVLLPAGIGARPPLASIAGRITGARCFGAVVTLDPTGVALVPPGARLRLSDLFAAWGEPLSKQRVASFREPRGRHIAVFVDGRRWPGRPGTVPLRRHAEIVIEAGPYVPPHRSYDFPLAP